MSSEQSSSILSKPKPAWLDPSVILLPIFIGFLRAAPIVPFVAMFLGPDFGLTNDHPAPNAWALAAISAIGFWSARFLPKYVRNPRIFNPLLLGLGIVLWLGWMALEPNWHVGDVLGNPISMVSGNGQFAWTFILTIIFWVLTLRLALDVREQSSEAVRGIMVRSLVAVLLAVFLAAVIGGDMGDAGLTAGYIALPVALVSGIGAVGLSEMVATRDAARRRGATVPGWSRWGRTFAGSAVIVLIITFIAAVIFGPGFLALMLDTLATLWRGIAQVILWVMYGFVYLLYWIARGVVWLYNLLFDSNVEPMEMPAMGEMGGEEPGEPVEESEVEPWQYASLARFAGIIALVIVALAIVARFIRFRGGEEDTDLDEERTSVFSGSLLRKQLRNLFRRRVHAEKPRKLNLASEPESVRESMLYLQVLATRLGTPRVAHETPHDFTNRLSRDWSGLDEPLGEIRTRYERVRYGESDEDRAAVAAAWLQIWSAQKDVLGASGTKG